MAPPRSLERTVWTVVATLGLVGLAAVAWRMLGGLGLIVLGLLVSFIGVRIEQEEDRPVGPPMTPGLFADQHRHEAASARSERAERAAHRGMFLRGARLATLLGVLVALTGIASVLAG